MKLNPQSTHTTTPKNPIQIREGAPNQHESYHQTRASKV